MEDQHPVLHEESLQCLQRVAAVRLGVTSEPLNVVVAQVHGVDVVGHVGSSKQHKTTDQPVTVVDPININMQAINI